MKRHKWIYKTYKKKVCSFCGLIRIDPKKSAVYYVYDEIQLVREPPCMDPKQGNIFHGYRETEIPNEPAKDSRKEVSDLQRRSIDNKNLLSDSKEGGYTSLEAIVKDCREIFNIETEIWKLPKK